jgi:hypothetical protein
LGQPLAGGHASPWESGRTSSASPYDLVVTIEDWGVGTHPRPPKKRASYRSGGTWWPAGERVVASDGLRYVLARSGRWHARLALELFASPDLDEMLQAAISTGTAVELVAKAYLASVTPSLLAFRGHRDSLLLLGGRSVHVEDTATSMRSIQAGEALQLVKHLHPELPGDLNDPPPLRVRNAAAHMALVDAEELRQAIVQMARLIGALLPLLELDPDPFWGRRAAAVVKSLLDEAQSEISRLVQVKRATAEARIDRLTAAVGGPNQIEPFLELLEAVTPPNSEHVEEQWCPICEHRGWLGCYVKTGPIEVDYDREGHPEGAWVPRFAYPSTFTCPVCQFEIEEEELEEFDFPREIELEVMSTAEYYGDD